MEKNNELIENLNSVSEEEAKNIKEDWLQTAKSSMKWSWILFAATFALFFILYLMDAAERVSPESEMNIISTAYWACPLLYVFCCVYGLNGYRAANSIKVVNNGHNKESKKAAIWSIIPSFILTLPFILIVELIGKNKSKKEQSTTEE